jgi:hypothetical protein
MQYSDMLHDVAHPRAGHFQQAGGLKCFKTVYAMSVRHHPYSLMLSSIGFCYNKGFANLVDIVKFMYDYAPSQRDALKQKGVHLFHMAVEESHMSLFVFGCLCVQHQRPANMLP